MQDIGFTDGDGEDAVDPIANGDANGAFAALGAEDVDAAQSMEMSSSMFGGESTPQSAFDIVWRHTLP